MNLNLTVDTRELFAALDRLGDQVLKHTQPVARRTGERVVREAKARVARRTGQTAEGISVEEHGPDVLVVARRQQFPDLPAWIEKGTKHMRPRPFLEPSVRLEEASHQRGIAEAVQAAIDSEGLG